ncbi:hypothetical protein TNCV_3473301 [Trichonephila clavipes]|nr:hypothetical protein TNCV_3473301 [Trichonephila clavipes]
MGLVLLLLLGAAIVENVEYAPVLDGGFGCFLYSRSKLLNMDFQLLVDCDWCALGLSSHSVNIFQLALRKVQDLIFWGAESIFKSRVVMIRNVLDDWGFDQKLESTFNAVRSVFPELRIAFDLKDQIMIKFGFLETSNMGINVVKKRR